MNDVMELLQTAVVTDYRDVQTEEPEGFREVLCSIKSVGMRESYAALAAGVTPEIKAFLACGEDYQGEEFARFEGVMYKIIRSYRTGRGIELTLARAPIGLSPDVG